MTERSASPAAERPDEPDPAAADTDASLVARRLATAELVLEIATAAAGELELDEILRAALDRLRGVIPFTGGSIALVDGDDLVIRAAVGVFAAEALGSRLARPRGRSWRIVETLEPVLIEDMIEEGIRTSGALASKEMRSWLGVAIPRRGIGIGILEVDSTSPGAFAEADVELLQTVARALAGPIDLAARAAAERHSRNVRDAFSGMVSHELRTPITTIFGMSQVLRQRHAALPPDERAHLIEDIESEADRLRRLVEDLLILGRAEGGRFDLDREPIVLAHLIGRAVADEGRRWPAHRMVANVSRSLPIVVGEEVYVEQVVRNLLSNAAKYSSSGTEVVVDADVEGSSVAVRVLDEGMGLPEGSADQLFDLYYRAPEATRQAAGAGIGLFVCRTLVQAMGGRVWARPRDKGGSEFGFTLPIESDG